MSKSKTTFSLVHLYPLLLALLPFTYIAVFPDPSAAPLFLLIDILCCIFLAYTFRAAQAIALPASFRLLFSLLMLLLLTGITSAVVHSANKECLPELARTGSLILFFYTTAIFILLYEDAFRHLVYALGLMAVGYLCLGLYEAMELGGDFMDMELSYGIRGHLGHRNLMCIFFALSLPLYAWIISTDARRWIRYAAALTMMVTSVFLLLLASRVGWLGLLCFIVIYGIRTRRYFQRHTLRQAMPALAAIALVVTVALSTILTHSQSIKNIRQKLMAFTKVNQEIDPNTYTINERLELWHVSLSMAGRHPLLGVGPGMWQFHYPERGLTGTQAQSGRILFQRPHNDLIWYLCEYGVIGLLLFLSAMGAAVWACLRAISSGGSMEEAYLGLAGIVIFTVTGFVDFPKERPVHLFMLSFYLAVIALRVPSAFSLPAWTTYGSKIFARLALVLGLSLCTYWGLRSAGEYKINTVLSHRMAGDYHGMAAAISDAHSLLTDYDLTGTPLDFYLGEAAFYQHDVPGAMDHFSMALRRNPYHLYTLSNMGSCYWAAGRRADALAMWDSAIHIASCFGEARLNKSIALFESGDTAGAVRTLHYPMLKEDTATYRTQIITIYGTFIISRARVVEEPVIKEQMLEIAQTDEWLMALYAKMIKKSDPPALIALQEALWVCDHDRHLITPQQHEQILQKYDKQMR